MTKLETLYLSIEGLKKFGLPLNEETLKAVDNLEEDLIKNEVIPRLSNSIEPIITQIQRPIVLAVDYVHGENLSVRLTRKRIIIEEPRTPNSIISYLKNSNHPIKRIKRLHQLQSVITCTMYKQLNRLCITITLSM